MVLNAQFWCRFRSDRMVFQVTTAGNRIPSTLLLTGTAQALALQWWQDRCPFGVLLDRLQEEPAECVPFDQWQLPLSEGDVLDAVQWLRQHRPNYV